MDFNNIIGNENAKQILKRAVQTNNILHSYLFVGTEGIGKKLIAREFSKMILCEGQNKPCENCKSCISFKNANNIDFSELDVLSGENKIKIEQIRQMQQDIMEKPVQSSRKVYIINNSEKMTTSAQNCLLKTLEEPPKYATIILISSNESELLSTIKSRCVKVNFEKISDEQIEKYLKENEIVQNISKNIISMCEGSIARANKIKEKKEIYEKTDKIINDLEKEDLIDNLNNLEEFNKMKDEIKEVFEYMNIVLHSKGAIKYIKCIEHVENAKERLGLNANFDMTIDRMILKIWEDINEKNSRC